MLGQIQKKTFFFHSRVKLFKIYKMFAKSFQIVVPNRQTATSINQWFFPASQHFSKQFLVTTFSSYTNLVLFPLRTENGFRDAQFLIMGIVKRHIVSSLVHTMAFLAFMVLNSLVIHVVCNVEL